MSKKRKKRAASAPAEKALATVALVVPADRGVAMHEGRRVSAGDRVDVSISDLPALLAAGWERADQTKTEPKAEAEALATNGEE